MKLGSSSVVALAGIVALVACDGSDPAPTSSSTSSSSGAGSSTSGGASASSGGGGTTTSSSGATSSTTSTSGSTGATANVTGAWIGFVDNGGSYLDLMQTGTAVTGTGCEQPGKSCAPIVGGLVNGDQFTGKYSTSSTTYSMDMRVAADNRSMTGKYRSTKCSCDFNVSLGKQN